MTTKFLSEATEQIAHFPLQFRCWGASDWTDAHVAEECISEARGVLGKESENSDGLKTWEINSNKAEQAISLVLNSDKWPIQKSGPNEFHALYTFFWKDLAYSVPENLYQNDFACRLGVIGSAQKIFLQPHFIFPMAIGSQEFWKLFEKVEKLSPFRFREQYFSRLYPKIKGRGFRSLRIKKGEISFNTLLHTSSQVSR